MKQAKKVLLLVLCAVLLVGASVAGTVAYLTDVEVVNNTFAVGDVKIYLDETDIDNSNTKYGYDALLHEGRDLANKYEGDNKLIPGRTVTKDPVITVLANSEDCYVRAKVTVTVPHWPAGTTGEEFATFAGSFAENYILSDATSASGFNTTSWTPSTPSAQDGTIDTDTKTITYYLTYKIGSDNIVESSTADIALPALFNDISVPSTLDNTTLSYLKDMTIKVEAHAIQADGFANADAAWAAFN